METRTEAMHGAGVVDLVMRIPGDSVDALRLPPDEVEDTLHKELALALYQRGVLSSGKASVLAGMGRWEFEELLGQRQIRRHYTSTLETQKTAAAIRLSPKSQNTED